MMPGMNPRKMQQMMKKMGIAQSELEATEVIIRFADKELVFTNPQVTKVNMMGQQTYQIIGEPHERSKVLEVNITEEDIKTVADQANVELSVAEETLKETNGDIAEAIMKLTS